MENYEYSKAKLELEMFFWQVFCDNYLEFVKDRLYNPGNYHDGAKPSAQFTLYEALLNILKLLAPVMPFITEELYHQYFSKTEKTGSVHKSSWPVFNETLIDEDAEKAGDYAVIIASEARKYKSSKQLSLKAELGTIVVICSATQRKLIEGLVKDLLVLANAKDLEFEDGDTLSIKFA
jgi:valyl-tRNA synthetase